MLLVIDTGNTRTKWGVFDRLGSMRALGACANTELDALLTPAEWHHCQSVIISNVAGASMANKLNTLLHPLNLPMRWVVASTQACGLENSYSNPAQLGTDRWAAMIAAWHQFKKPCIVINAGTALTIDAIATKNAENHGVFVGGIIVPGLKLMQNSLIQGTADINHQTGSWQEFPTSTGAAVYTGALNAMAGAVTSMFDKLQQFAGATPHCIMSGGDAAALATVLNKTMNNHLLIADNLVLQGLLCLERETS